MPSGRTSACSTSRILTVADSFLSVFVRVNIKGVQDGGTYGYTAADNDSVCILGDGKGGPDLDWGTPFYLTAEKSPTNSPDRLRDAREHVLLGAPAVPQIAAHRGADVAYKFRFGSNWNYGALQRSEQLGAQYAGGNRHFSIPQGLKDTTLQWVYFGDATPIPEVEPGHVHHYVERQPLERDRQGRIHAGRYD